MINYPSTYQVKAHILSSLSLYWPGRADEIAELPVLRHSDFPELSCPLALVAVELPDWAEMAGVHGQILVPIEAVVTSSRLSEGATRWSEVDWFLAAFLMLEGCHERLWEQKYGVIHSYSFRLAGWDSRLWDHAWVNRIGLFLLIWATKEGNLSGKAQVGLPLRAKIALTHDVDAVAKTLSIRLKQSAFIAFNAIGLLARGRIKAALSAARKSAIFLFGYDNWWVFDELLSLEEQYSVKSIFHFHGDKRSMSLKRWIFDPSYNPSDQSILDLLEDIKLAGHEIGVHPSYDNWANTELLKQQKEYISVLAGCQVLSCRQHWLRFSWSDTWAAQESAGIGIDRTMMFNDRPGFRNASALRWKPWDFTTSQSHRIEAQPTVIMDSHLFDYQQLTDDERIVEIDSWLDECAEVGGEIAVLWHPHTLSNDYGWRGAFEVLLSRLGEGSSV